MKAEVAHMLHAKRYTRSDGFVKNHMGILKDQMRIFTNRQQSNWEAHAYRTTINPPLSS